MSSVHGFLRYGAHSVVLAFTLGFSLGLIDNTIYLDSLPHPLMHKIIAVLYSSLAYGFFFACAGLLLTVLMLNFWRRPLHDPAARQRAHAILVTLLSAGFLFIMIGMWYYGDASYKVSLAEYVTGSETLLIALFSLAGGAFLSLGMRLCTSALGRLKIPFAALVLVAAALWALHLAGTLSQSPQTTRQIQPPATKIALIGIDAASWNFLLPWINQGKLPHLQQLMQEGTWGVLRSRHPTRSPAIWTGIVTGKKRAKHGIYDFLQPEANNLVPAGSHHRRVKALWNILSDQHRSAWVIDWMATYPPEQINGVMVTNLLENQAVPVYNQPDSIYPLAVKPVIDRLTQPYRIESFTYPTSRFTDEHYGRLEQKYFSELNVVEQVALYGCQQSWDLLAIYTHAPDAVLHHFWKFMEPERFHDPVYGLTPENVARFGETAMRHFQRTDEMLGRLLDCLDDQTVVMVVSDHGQEGRTHKPEKDNDYNSGHHHNDGIIVMRGPGIRQGYLLTQKTVDTPAIEFAKMIHDKIFPIDVEQALRQLRLLDDLDILDITPTILYLLGLPVAEDMDGKVITQALDTTTLARHPIHSVPTYEDGGHSPRSRPSPVMSQEMKERLRSLGYIQ